MMRDYHYHCHDCGHVLETHMPPMRDPLDEDALVGVCLECRLTYFKRMDKHMPLAFPLVIDADGKWEGFIYRD